MKKESNFEIVHIDNRKIIIKGIGKLFYQHGYPISMSIDSSQNNDYEVSIFHIVDELKNNGWTPKTIFSRLKEDISLYTVDNYKALVESLEKFCFASYEEQREMIFQYLWGEPSNSIIKKVKNKEKNIITDTI